MTTEKITQECIWEGSNMYRLLLGQDDSWPAVSVHRMIFEREPSGSLRIRQQQMKESPNR